MTREDTRRDREEYTRRPDKNFVGRKNELKEFRKRLKSCRKKPVWHLHGVSGVGKSELLKFFREECGDKSRPCAYVDLRTDTAKSEAGLLKEIADELRESPFKSFGKEYRKLQPAQQQVRPVVQRLVEVGETAAQVVAVVGTGQPFAAAGVKAAGAAGHYAADLVRDRQPGGDRLFDSFLKDLHNLIERRAQALPVVLLLDTYEQASPVQEGIIQDLILACRAACPDVLFVLTGWEPLGWEHPDQNPIWREEKLIAQQRLDEFVDKDARAYLKKRKVTDPDLATRILKLTRGFPMFLRLACDIVDRARHARETVTADEFPEGQLDHDRVAEFLVRRIIERLPEDRKHLEPAIKLLGIPRWFDLPVFALLLGKKPIEADADWRQLLEMSSLFQPTGRLDRHRYHDCVRDAVLSWWKRAEEEKIAHHRTFAKWHLERVKKSKGALGFDHMREGLYHGVPYKPLAVIRVWSALCQTALAARQMAHCEILLDDARDYPVPYTDLAAAEAGEVHLLIGNAFNSYPTKRAGVMGEAIRHYKAALKFYTEDEFPQNWAMTQNNLGSAYWNLPTGDRGENLKKAIECYQGALRVYTEKEFPQDWAGTQNNLGNAYSDLPTGDRGKNLKKAIECYRAALKVRTEKELPQDWAMTQNNLGIAHAQLPTGDRGDNLKKAIECYRAALRVYTEKEFPQDWAETMYNLGLARGDVGAQTDNIEHLKEARRCFLDAARGYRAVGNAEWAERVESMAAKMAEFLKRPGK